MHPTRRGLLCGGVALAAVLAGCLDRPLASFVASPATVPAAALGPTGYAEAGVDEQVLTQGVGPARRAVEVRNWVARYERPLSPATIEALPATPTAGEDARGPVALFAVLSTPTVAVGGQAFNPVGGFSANDIVEQAQNAYGELREFERVDDREVATLGETTRVVEYRAAGDVEGLGVPSTAGTAGLTDLTVHVSDPVAHGTDFVLAVAVHPSVAGIEPRVVDRLLGSVEHPDAAAGSGPAS